jgi:hypothetical protein
MSRQGEIELTWTNEDGDEVTHTFPSTNEVCERCEGYGTHLNSNIGSYGYSAEEFAESFPDDNLMGYNPREEYFKRGGIYDVTCEECNGNKVVEVVDEDKLNEEQKKLFAKYEEYMEEKAADEAADLRTRWVKDGCPRD